jgi:hypothetical protein
MSGCRAEEDSWNEQEQASSSRGQRRSAAKPISPEPQRRTRLSTPGHGDADLLRQGLKQDDAEGFEGAHGSSRAAPGKEESAFTPASPVGSWAALAQVHRLHGPILQAWALKLEHGLQDKILEGSGWEAAAHADSVLVLATRCCNIPLRCNDPSIHHILSFGRSRPSYSVLHPSLSSTRAKCSLQTVRPQQFDDALYALYAHILQHKLNLFSAHESAFLKIV